MSGQNQSRNSRQNTSPAEARTSSKVTAGGSSGTEGRRRGKIRRFLGKVKNVTQKISHSKDSRGRDPVLLNVDREGAPSTANIEARDVSTGMEQGADPQSALQDAQETVKLMTPLSAYVASGQSAVKDSPVDLEAAYNFQDTYLQPLRIFDGVIRTLAEVHPYAKLALSVLSWAAKIILAQADRDTAILGLLQKLGDVYGFITEDKRLHQISSMHTILGQISQQTLECAYFIRDYSETKNFWRRAGKNIGWETDDAIRGYSGMLDKLMDNFQKQVTRDVAIYVHRTGETLDLSGMSYADGAGRDTGKQCLPGTRTEIISDITDWINNTGDDVQRVLWLSGPAGKGKSAIAHTIANWFNDVGGLGSCYCFDHQRAADRRHERIFSTIARDLADRDPEMRRALAEVVKDASSLKTTVDIVQQWDNLLMKPLGKSSGSIVRPVVIVIEALDESGGVETRLRLLQILAGKLGVQRITELPANFRVIVTSRPLRDIEAELAGARHIRRMSMDDISSATTERDIHTYVSKELEGLSNFGDREFTTLAEKADGLFEWARLACRYIKAPPPGLSAIECFGLVTSRDVAEQENLLYDMYQFILTEVMRKGKSTHTASQHKQLARFRSVMSQILGAAEPLSLESLNVIRSYFPDTSEHYEVQVMIEHMGSLLSGTTNSSTPIRLLHGSFRDFLTNQSYSGEFFVDVSKVQRDLAFASLRVMEHGLSFNICDLKSSYLPNSEDPGLRERVEKCIPPHLSYACRFWPVHLQTTSFETELANEVKLFFDHQRLLFWIEVLGIIKALSSAVPALPRIAQWLMGQSGYEDISFAAMDVQRFIQVFGGMILHSTPHLYVSALPFSPLNSTISRKCTAKFLNTLRVASGRNKNWTAVQTVIRGHTGYVYSVSFSPDGTRIATGSDDCTVRLWDAVTGQSIGKPLRGHTSSVTSVSFSPDGTRIVSGSDDNTIRLWDVATWQPVGEPLYGHTDTIYSVSFSPSGTRIVTGSADNTIRLWDTAARHPIGAPLQGHTQGVNSVSFSPDETRIVSGSNDKTIRLWETATGQPAGEPLLGHTDAVRSVSFSPDGTCIATGSSDKTVRLWHAATRKPVCEPLEGHTDWVGSVSFSPDGSRIVTGSHDGTVRLWNSATGRPVGEPLLGHTWQVLSVSFSPDGTRIATGSADNTVRLWDPATEQPVGEPSQELTNSITSGSLSPDGTRFAIGFWDGTVRLLNITTGQPVGELFQGHIRAVSSISFSPDGTRMATGSRDRTVRLWDTATGQPVGGPLIGHTDEVGSISFSPDGTRIVTGSDDKTVRLWNAGTGQPVGEPLRGHNLGVRSVSFSPDGTRIATGSRDKTVRLWDAATGQPIGEPLIGHTDEVSSVSFSPNGTRIVTGSYDKTIRLWDAGTGKPVGGPLQGHIHWVRSVAFSRDGTRIVSGLNDETVRLWDVATGQPVGLPLRGHTELVSSASFSRDGTRVVSCSWDGTFRVWYAAIGKSLEDYVEEDRSAPSLHGSCVTHPTVAIPTPNIADDDFISFSSNPAYALRGTAELLACTPHDDRSLTFALLGDDGWMMGPNRQLLFWVPPASREAFRYNPRTALVIGRGCVELDLSRMAHGTCWQHCYGSS